MAEDTLTAVERQLGKALPTPEAMPLRGAAESLEATQQGLQRQKQQLKSLLPETALLGAQVAHLQGTYGLEAVALIERAEPSRREPLSPVIPLCGAELDHSIQREHARSSSDVLARRCRLAMVDLNEAERLRPQVEELLNQAGVRLYGTRWATSFSSLYSSHSTSAVWQVSQKRSLEKSIHSSVTALAIASISGNAISAKVSSSCGSKLDSASIKSWAFSSKASAIPLIIP